LGNEVPLVTERYLLLGLRVGLETNKSSVHHESESTIRLVAEVG
jgi:hypothetical protein